MKNKLIGFTLTFVIILVSCGRATELDNSEVSEVLCEEINTVTPKEDDEVITSEEIETNQGQSEDDGRETILQIWPIDRDISGMQSESIVVDYIFVTKGVHGQEPQKLREGDSLLGLTLEELPYPSIRVIENKYFRLSSIEARFVGEIIVNGNLELIRDHETGFSANQFVVHESSYGILPWLYGDYRGVAFHISNFEKLTELFGITEETITDTEFGYYKINDITIKIDDLTLLYISTNFGNSAKIIEVISWSGQHLQ